MITFKFTFKILSSTLKPDFSDGPPLVTFDIKIPYNNEINIVINIMIRR